MPKICAGNSVSAVNLHIHKFKVKSAALQKFPMRNIHNKRNIF